MQAIGCLKNMTLNDITKKISSVVSVHQSNTENEKINEKINEKNNNDNRSVSSCHEPVLNYKEEYERLRVVLDGASVPLIVTDSAGIIEEYNDACESLFQRNAASYIGHNIAELAVQASDAEQMLDFIKKCRGHSELPWIQHILLKREMASFFWAEVRLNVVRTSFQKLATFTFRDVSDVRKEFDELEVQKRRWLSWMSSTEDGVFFCNDEGTILACGGHFIRRSMGYTPSDLNGGNIKELLSVGGDHGDGFPSRYLLMKEEATVKSYTRTTIPVEMTVSEVDCSLPKEYIVIIKDVTEKIELEDEIQAYQERERASSQGSNGSYMKGGGVLDNNNDAYTVASCNIGNHSGSSAIMTPGVNPDMMWSELQDMYDNRSVSADIDDRASASCYMNNNNNSSNSTPHIVNASNWDREDISVRITEQWQ